jgi:hypothetical protein
MSHGRVPCVAWPRPAGRLGLGHGELSSCPGSAVCITQRPPEPDLQFLVQQFVCDRWRSRRAGRPPDPTRPGSLRACEGEAVSSGPRHAVARRSAIVTQPAKAAPVQSRNQENVAIREDRRHTRKSDDRAACSFGRSIRPANTLGRHTTKVGPYAVLLCYQHDAGGQIAVGAGFDLSCRKLR